MIRALKYSDMRNYQMWTGVDIAENRLLKTFFAEIYFPENVKSLKFRPFFCLKFRSFQSHYFVSPVTFSEKLVVK